MVKDINSSKKQLLCLLEDLNMTNAAGADEQAIVQLDQQSVGRLNRMDALQRQQMAKEAGRRRKVERIKILAALQRIEDDEFGWCAECGEEIAAARIEANPTAHLCLDCAR